MKFSAFKCVVFSLHPPLFPPLPSFLLTAPAHSYHMQYYHGISAPTGRPFSPPTAFRTVARPHASKHEKTRIMEGKCHRCARWVAVEGIKDVEAKVREMFWWKHAAGCHQGDVLDGEADGVVEDEVWRAVVGAGDGVQGESEGEGDRESEDGEREDDRR